MTQAAAKAPPASAPPGRATTTAAIVLSIVLVEMSSGITQGFLAPVLRSLTDVLHVTAAQLNWISIANLMASVAFTPLLSRLGDLHGHRRVLRWNLAVVLLGSVVVGLSGSFRTLLLGQILQGAFAGFFPLLVGILRNRTSEAESRRSIGVMVAGLVGGLCVGMVASGLVAHYVDTPTSALWVPAAAVGIALLVTWPLLPETTERPGGHLDARGGALLCVGLVAIMLGLGQGGLPGWEWASPRTLGCLVGGAAVTAVWAVVELRSPEPMIDVRLFRRRNVTVMALVTTTFSFCMIGLQVAGAVFLGTPRELVGYGMGLAPLQIAFATIPGLAVIALAAMAAPRLAARIGDRATLVLGSLLMAAGYALTLAFHSTLTPYLLSTVVAGIGTGLLQQSTRTLAVESVPDEQAAVGSGINELLINVGGSLGAACVLAVTAAHTSAGSSLPGFGAYTTTWSVCVGVSLLGALVALLYRRSDLRPDVTA
ncbi:MFS transporter [Streptomyces sp. NBC_00385]|uniref:MFS transporter n=1 Tax=Streptomyces sp. NBC_00385 TaxID=2975733 RepID=UPI002DD81299|nr:MFS transporter [Streptomyces sp. NBC_00385]WRZ03038.1 MFS transporter [Streptomyces sp. NBC_00385]